MSVWATAAPSSGEQTVSGARRPGMGNLRVAEVAGIALALLPHNRQQRKKTPDVTPIVEEVLHTCSDC